MSESMFPAPAGMSPTLGDPDSIDENVPRTRGDEPGILYSSEIEL